MKREPSTRGSVGRARAKSAPNQTSYHQVRVWVLSWFNRVKGRHVRAIDSLSSLRYDNETHLSYLAESVNQTFGGQIVTAELSELWKDENETRAGPGNLDRTTSGVSADGGQD